MSEGAPPPRRRVEPPCLPCPSNTTTALVIARSRSDEAISFYSGELPAKDEIPFDCAQDRLRSLRSLLRSLAQVSVTRNDDPRHGRLRMTFQRKYGCSTNRETSRGTPRECPDYWDDARVLKWSRSKIPRLMTPRDTSWVCLSPNKTCFCN
jgi:hypothetical protein